MSVSVQGGGLCPGGVCPGGFFLQGVSVQGVSVQGDSVQGVYVQGGLCQGYRPPYGNIRAIRVLLECIVFFEHFNLMVLGSIHN